MPSESGPARQPGIHIISEISQRRQIEDLYADRNPGKTKEEIAEIVDRSIGQSGERQVLERARKKNGWAPLEPRVEGVVSQNFACTTTDPRAKKLMRQKMGKIQEDMDARIASRANNLGNVARQRRPRNIEQRRPERNVREDKSVVVRQLFELFKEKPKWGTKEIRERTKQPEAWLKEILQGQCHVAQLCILLAELTVTKLCRDVQLQQSRACMVSVKSSLIAQEIVGCVHWRVYCSVVCTAL